ncbi:uncharacterized protein LOC131525799 isoform X2 [Onychostoma macrolepis]|uniref:uncharacterized protein LOC131525799 isoform X2 n=1 Tax=Onychostoma macrolepis TaxID=369639 RepID=UPI00272AA19D|nr:uncharacterized protein LOC131525799 isoform X2 [Onychostoma macrolepis]
MKTGQMTKWRHGCAVEHHSNGSVIFLQGTDEYAYDGENLTFNLSMHWKPLVLEHNIIWNRESVSSLEKKCVEMLTSFTNLQREDEIKTCKMDIMNSSLQWVWVGVCVIVLLGFLIGIPIIGLSSHRLIKYFKHPEKQKTLKTPSQEKLLTLYKTQMEPELLKEIRPETRAGLAVALNAASDDENPADDSLEKVQTEELHETQSLCEAKETPSAAPTAARGAMGSKNISLPNFEHCIFRNISMPHLALERKDTSDSS